MAAEKGIKEKIMMHDGAMMGWMAAGMMIWWLVGLLLVVLLIVVIFKLLKK